MDKARLNEVKALKKTAQDKNKSKDFKNLTRPEKDELLETLCKMLGIIK